jgi:hypothetical protein
MNSFFCDTVFLICLGVEHWPFLLFLIIFFIQQVHMTTSEPNRRQGIIFEDIKVIKHISSVQKLILGEKAKYMQYLKGIELLHPKNGFFFLLEKLLLSTSTFVTRISFIGACLMSPVQFPTFLLLNDFHVLRRTFFIKETHSSDSFILYILEEYYAI